MSVVANPTLLGRCLENNTECNPSVIDTRGIVPLLFLLLALARICIFARAGSLGWISDSSGVDERDAENIVGDIQIAEPADVASVTGRHNS
jgi:hypothetical protein